MAARCSLCTEHCTLESVLDYNGNFHRTVKIHCFQDIKSKTKHCFLNNQIIFLETKLFSRSDSLSTNLQRVLFFKLIIICVDK